MHTLSGSVVRSTSLLPNHGLAISSSCNIIKKAMLFLRPYARLVHFTALTLIDHASSDTNIATFSDPHCQDSYRNLDGPNGYPNGTCTMLQAKGNYSSFQVVNVDPGCTGIVSIALNVTIYGSDSTHLQCSLAVLQFADTARCYNTSWKYYSIDSCAVPNVLSLSSTTLSTLSTTSSRLAGSKPTIGTAASSPSSQRFNAAAIAGVTVGSVSGVIVALVTLFYLLGKWRRTKHGTESQQQPVDNKTDHFVPEKDASMPVQELHSVPEIHGDSYWEMAAPHGMAEPASEQIYELPDGERGYDRFALRKDVKDDCL